MYKKNYQTIALGGTFDRLHDGHKKFINFAAELADQLIIGVTNSKLTLHKKYADQIQPAHKRMSVVSTYCKKNGIKARIVELHDPYGPTIDDTSIQALAVTEATVSGAKQINELRDKMRLPELPVHVCQLLKDESGHILSSERIRSGVVNRSGTPYNTCLKKSIQINEKGRQYFSRRHGALVKEPQSRPIVCLVGDATVEFFRAKFWEYNLGVYDLKQQRDPYTSPYLESIDPDYTATSPAGEITEELITTTIQAVSQLEGTQQTLHLKVEGEEDLAAAVLVLILPLGSLIYYGQPGEGTVELEVTEKLKEAVYSILSNSQ